MSSSQTKYCVTFAGPIGSSKTPIAQYLSYTFNLPIFSNDTIRTEVVEDLLEVKKEEYEKRRNERGEGLLKNGDSFIYDASIDREWEKLSDNLVRHGYACFIVSLDLSKELLAALYKAKGYLESLKRIDALIADHQKFLVEYGNIINVRVDDQNFPGRLTLVANNLDKWLSGGQE